MVATVADWLVHPVMSLSLVAPNLWIHYPPPSFVTIPIHHHHRLSHTLFSLLSLSFSISISISKVHPLPLGLEKDGFVNPNISISKIHPFSLQIEKWVGL